MTDEVLRFEDVRREFKRGRPVLQGVSFAMGRGEIVGLLGANGAGKTTLIRTAMGMLFPDAGWVRAVGMDPAREGVAWRCICALTSGLPGCWQRRRLRA